MVWKASAGVMCLPWAFLGRLQGLLGLSIDAFAKTKTRTEGGARLREATKFTKVNSVDLIVEPGAGGGLDRLTEAAADQEPPSQTTGADPMKKRLLEAIKAKDAARGRQAVPMGFNQPQAVRVGSGHAA